MATTVKNSVVPLVAAAGLVLGIFSACSEGAGGDGGSGGGASPTTSTTTSTGATTTTTTTGASTSASTGGGLVFEKGWTFDTDVEGWAITDATPVDLKMTAMLEHDAAVGNPDPMGSPAPGSLKLTIPFSAELQSVLLTLKLPAALNLTGKTLVASFKIDQGIDMTKPSGGVVFAQSGTDYAWCDSGGGTSWTNLISATAWAQAKFSGKSFDPVAAGCYVAPDAGPSTFKIDGIVQIGIKIGTGTGAMPDPATPTIVHIDNIGYY